MYKLKTSASFDSAHFLSGYEGKCANIHGHHWVIEAEFSGNSLQSEGTHRDMLVDFGDLKADLKAVCDSFDHRLIYEDGSLSETAMGALSEEGFSGRAIPVRPTAENLAKLFCDEMTAKGYDVRRVEVYETPNNMAAYEPDEKDQGGH